jgi:hypothetical protein
MTNAVAVVFQAKAGKAGSAVRSPNGANLHPSTDGCSGFELLGFRSSVFAHQTHFRILQRHRSSLSSLLLFTPIRLPFTPSFTIALDMSVSHGSFCVRENSSLRVRVHEVICMSVCRLRISRGVQSPSASALSAISAATPAASSSSSSASSASPASSKSTSSFSCAVCKSDLSELDRHQRFTHRLACKASFPKTGRTCRLGCVRLDLTPYHLKTLNRWKEHIRSDEHQQRFAALSRDTIDFNRSYGALPFADTHPAFNSESYLRALHSFRGLGDTLVTLGTASTSRANSIKRDMLVEWNLISPNTKPFRYSTSGTDVLAFTSSNNTCTQCHSRTHCSFTYACTCSLLCALPGCVGVWAYHVGCLVDDDDPLKRKKFRFIERATPQIIMFSRQCNTHRMTSMVWMCA